MNLKSAKKHYKSIIILSLISCFSLVGCEGGSGSNTGALAFLFSSGADYTKVLKYSGTNVVLPSLLALKNDTATLETKALAYYTSQNPTTLGELQNAWKAAHVSLKRVEVFYFGPGTYPSTKNYYVKMDAFETISARPLWTYVNKMITNTAACATTNPMTSTDLASCSVIYKGFESLEMLIFSSDGLASTIDDATSINSVNTAGSRRLEYLKSLAQLINQDANSLYNSWDPSGENFLGNFIAGNGSYFPNQGVAFDTYVQSLGNIVYQIWDGKLGGPACLTPGCSTNPNPKSTEATFSRNAYQDLYENLLGLELGYQGNPADTDAVTLSTMIQAQNSQLDTDIKAAIAALKSAINTSNDLYAQIDTDGASVGTSINTNVKPIYNLATTLKVLFNVDAFSALGVPSLPPAADGD
ncbi:imelysin family protein [Leptospira selangorensis]|uniref:imelysin family protein n=1 Tax=Leptospira selangorensis TaxID=2484982 RepID=UPI001ABF5297|nr:imelysin family protein [Leptospira selangorensis]